MYCVQTTYLIKLSIFVLYLKFLLLCRKNLTYCMSIYFFSFLLSLPLGSYHWRHLRVNFLESSVEIFFHVFCGFLFLLMAIMFSQCHLLKIFSLLHIIYLIIWHRLTVNAWEFNSGLSIFFQWSTGYFYLTTVKHW